MTLRSGTWTIVFTDLVGSTAQRTRVGARAADALPRDDDLFGTVVVEAQRICAAADAGEVLLSATVRSIAGSRAETTLVPVGPRNLKGIPEPIDIWRAEWSIIDDVAVPFPALLAPGAQLAFGGRAAELERLSATWNDVLDGRRRAVFVAGEPGIGKTRLAAEV